MVSVADHIRTEHRNIARVLKALEAIVDRLQVQRSREDMDRLFDVCHYVRVFPDAVHHPKEDACVFGPLREKAPEHSALIASVLEQHEQCGPLTEDLYRAARGFDAGEISAADLKAASDRYLAFQFEHMRLEENQILPLAEQVLDEAALGKAEKVFAGHADPLFGANLQAGFEALRARIVAST